MYSGICVCQAATLLAFPSDWNLPPTGAVLSISEASPLTTKKEAGPWANRTLPWDLIDLAEVTTQCLSDVCLKLPPRIPPETEHLGQ